VLLGWTANFAAAADANPEIENSKTQVQDVVAAARDLFDQAESAFTKAEREQRIQEAKKQVDVVRSADAASPWLLYLQARLLVLEGRHTEARDRLRDFLETREGRNEWSAYRVLGDLFVDRFPRLAKYQYERAAELKPNDPRTLLGQSLCAFQLADLDKARQFAQEAVTADGRRQARSLTQWAVVLQAQKRWSLAEPEAAEALRLVETEAARRPETRETLGLVETQVRLLVEIADGLVSENPSDAEAYLRCADYVRRQAEVENRLRRHDVLAVLALGVEKTAPNVPAKLRKAYGVELAELGRNDEAVAQFEQVLAADPEDNQAREWLGRLAAQSSRGSMGAP
jgi:tetratricopeptide (TPR) repeat protein